MDYLDTWRGMIEAKKLGLAKSIGVSNFNQQQIQRLTNSTGETPAVLQVEVLYCITFFFHGFAYDSIKKFTI